MIRGKRKCKRCGELGHGESSYKCRLNGTQKRKRKPRKNTTKYGQNAKVPSKRSKHQQDASSAAHVQECDATAPSSDVVHNDQQIVAALQTPIKQTRESIMQDSPIRVTRGRLAMLLGDGTSDTTTMESSPPKNLKPRKLTPRKLKTK